MDIRPIRTEADYEWALAEIARYFENEPELGSAEGDRFDVLAELIGAYENKHWNIPAPSPIDVIKTFMEMRGRKQSDLAQVLGSKSRASEVLRGERPLSLDMIRRLNNEWGISADLLVQPHSSSDATKHRKRDKAA